MVKFLYAFLLLWVATAAHADVDYAIDLTSPEHHSGTVKIEFPETRGPYLDVRMANWRAGRYEILDLPNGVREFAAKDGDGRALRWQKVDKSTWRVHLPRPTTVRLSYELYGNELGNRTRHIDDSHAYLNPSAVFMYADRYRQDPVSVTLKVPSVWRSFSGMERDSAGRFVAKDWDRLIDSPIESGINESRSFSQGGRRYDVVFWGKGNYDIDRTVADLGEIVAQAPSIWSGYPFDRYLFIIHATDGAGGATEHVNSTVIQRPRYMFQPRSAYLGFLTTAAHEFIHAWNVKAYRPAGLVPYDYQKENYSNLLWLAEGSTSYFADHLMLRAGLTGERDYYERLSRLIDAHLHRPGRAVQSVSEASFDEWIQPSGDRARNASVDIYSEGAIVSWMLDIALLDRTGGKVSYRDVHEALYRRFDAERRGFTDRDMLAVLRDLTGLSWEDWWERNVESPVDADFDALLAPVGLRLAAPMGANGEMTKAYAGWAGEESQNGIQLNRVERGSPAWEAGFTTGDYIVAFDGRRVSRDRFDAALSEFRPGDSVTVSYFRRDQLLQKTLKLGAAPLGPAMVAAVDDPSPEQIALYRRWLLIPHPAD